MSYAIDDMFGESDYDETYQKFIKWYKTGKTLTEENDEEENEYGTPRLRHDIYNGKLETADDLIKAILGFQDKNKDKMVLFLVSQEQGDKSMFQLESCEIEDNALVFRFSKSEMPNPMPAVYVVQGMEHELEGKDRTIRFELVCDGKTKEINELALDVMRFPEQPDVFYFLHMSVKDSNRKLNISKSAEAAVAPQTVGELIQTCEQLKIQSGSNGFFKKPVIFEIPSVPDKAFGDIDDLPEELKQAIGKLCVVDFASPAKAHAKIELMGFDRFKEFNKILNGGEFSVQNLVDSIRTFDKKLALFFMYMGKPYEIDEMKAEAGKPVWITLVPWGQVNESVKPMSDIEIWATYCDNSILSWN